MAKKLKNIHPGIVLLKEFIEPLGISQSHAARAIGVPPRRINEICLEKRGITADTAIRLGRFFGTTPYFWLGLQNDYEVEEATASGSYGRISPCSGLSPHQGAAL